MSTGGQNRGGLKGGRVTNKDCPREPDRAGAMAEGETTEAVRAVRTVLAENRVPDSRRENVSEEETFEGPVGSFFRPENPSEVIEEEEAILSGVQVQNGVEKGPFQLVFYKRIVEMVIDQINPKGERAERGLDEKRGRAALQGL